MWDSWEKQAVEKTLQEIIVVIWIGGSQPWSPLEQFLKYWYGGVAAGWLSW